MQAAVSAAEACDEQVEITSERSETRLTFANPDKTLTSVVSPVPVRTRKGTGWVDIDTTLVRNGDGSVAPVAVVEELRLSGGGSGPLLTFGAPGRRVSLTWPAVLPTPLLEGDTARYPEVMPGVDLQVHAGVDSYRQVFVVKTREAAANPALATLSFGVAAEGVTLRELPSGAIEAVDAGGEVVFAGPAPAMWDSPQPSAPVGPTGTFSAEAEQALAEEQTDGGTPTPHRMEHMPVDVTASTLSVTPVQEMLQSSETIFPVYIDPPLNKGVTYWTNVMNTNPDHSYYTQDSTHKVGRQYNTSNVWRTHLQFHGLDVMSGATILSAELKVTADHTAICGNASIELWKTGHISHFYQYTWNTDSKNDWISRLDTKPFNANEGSECPKADDENIFDAASIKTAVQATATAGGEAMTFGMKAANESDHLQWSYFLPNKTFLIVTYDHKPAVPVGLAFTTTTDCYVQCSSPAIVRTTTPTLRATVQDPNGGVLRTVFEVRTAPDLAAAIAVTTLEMPESIQTTVGPATGTAQSMVPAGKLSNGVTYYWHATTVDEEGLWSGWGAWQTVTIDTTAPGVTGVSSSQYPFKVWGAAVGTAGTFTFAASGDVNDYTWSVDGGSTTNTTSASVTYTPTTDMVHTLRVNAKDKAGNSGGNYDHQFWVTPVDTTVRCWYWNLNETSGTSAADTGKAACSPTDNTVVAVNGTLSGSAVFAAGHDGNGVSFTGTGGQVSMSQATVNTSQSFTVTAWVNPSDLSLGDQTVISQDGTNTSRFQLYYDAQANAGAGGWCFGMRATDTNTVIAAPVCATGTVPDSDDVMHPPANGTWVHLAAVYNSAAGTLQIHVMGNPTSCSGEMVQGSFTGSWTTSGPLVVGRAKAGASSAEYFRGVVDEVRAYPKALTTTKICQLAGQ